MCVSSHGSDRVNRSHKLRHWHCKPDGIRAAGHGEDEDKEAADDEAAGYRYEEGGLRLQQGLEVVGGVDVQGQQEEGDGVASDDAGRDFQDPARRGHEDTDVQVRAGEAKCSPEDTEKGGGVEGAAQGFPDAAAFSGSVVGGDDGLGGLAHAVGAALDEGADVDDGAVDGQGVASQITHNLAVEQDGQDAHGHVNEEGGEAGDSDFADFLHRAFDFYQFQSILFGDKMAQHHHQG